MVTRLVDWTARTGYHPFVIVAIFVVLGLSLGYVLGGIFGREFWRLQEHAERRLRDMAPADIILAAVGLTAGLVIAWLASVPLRLLEPAWLALLATALLFGLLGWAGAWISLVKKRDFAKALPSLDAAEDPALGSSGWKILDTSAVIDGRFADLMRLGLLEGELRVPRFVLSELHTLSDSADDIRRARGRRGLDLLAQLNQGQGGGVAVLEADYADIPDVDNKLLRLAVDTGAALITVDHNLTSVARVRDIVALNLNEIASAMRPVYLPGERMRLRVVKEGKEPGQGVGYLEDGTMVVVAGAKNRVGSDADVEVTSVLQTAAGRMVFSRLLVEEGSTDG